MLFGRIGAVLLLVTQFVLPVSLNGQSLDEHLLPLAPLLNKSWKGFLEAPDGSTRYKVILVYESILDGKAIRCRKTNDDLNNFGEGYFYWNDVEKRIAYLFIENYGTVSDGYATVEKGSVKIEGRLILPTQQNPDARQDYDFEETFEFVEKGIMINRWFHNALGPWRPGQVMRYISEDLPR